MTGMGVRVASGHPGVYEMAGDRSLNSLCRAIFYSIDRQELDVHGDPTFAVTPVR
jgi:hypothetical protein